MLPDMTIEQAEEVVLRSLKTLPHNNPGRSLEWNKGFQEAFNWTKDRLEGFKDLYVLKSSVHIAKAPEPVKPIPYKIGQILYRTSDGLKVMIVEGTSGHVALLQLNAGRPLKSEAGFFAGYTLPKDYGNITPDELLKISGGYTFVTRSKGKEMDLHWANRPEGESCCYHAKPTLGDWYS